MANELRLGLRELLRKARIEHNSDFLKEGIKVLSQALMELRGAMYTLGRTHTVSGCRIS